MINLYHLKYFCDACRAGSLSKSAEANRVTHSAISQAVQSLEQELGCGLILHAKRTFALTSEGQRLFENADAIFDSIQNTINKAQSESDVIFGTLRIGLSHSIGKHLAARKLQAFAKANPAVSLQVSIGNSRALENLLASKEIEIGLGVEDGSFAEYEREILDTCDFVLIGRKDKKRNEKVLLVGDKGPEVRAIRAHLRKNKEGYTFHQIQSWTMVYELVLLGMGIGLVPDFVYQSNRQELSLVSLGVPLPRVKLCAFYRSAMSQSLVARVFLDSLREHD